MAENTDNQVPNEAPNQAPKIDWVTERSACTLPKVFYRLRLEVEADVKTRNSLRPELAPYEFSITDDVKDFSVILQNGDVRKTVKFSLTDYAILVYDPNGNQLLEVTSRLSDAGKCELFFNQEVRESWQVRRIALEGLMFGNK